MYTAFGMKYKHLQNLITKKLYVLFADGGNPFISQSSFQVLDYLSARNDRQTTQKDIEKALVINRATTSKMLMLLEQKGLISRANSPDDARQKIVVLTEDGEKLRIHNIEKQHEFDTFLEGVLSDEDFKAFDRIYEKMRNALED